MDSGATYNLRIKPGQINVGHSYLSNVDISAYDSRCKFVVVDK